MADLSSFPLPGSLYPVSDGASVHTLSLQDADAEGVVRWHAPASLSHACIHVPANAVWTVFVEISGGTTVVEAHVDDDAELRVICLQQGAQEAVIHQRGRIGARARVQWQNVTLGTSVHHDLETELTGAHAESTVDWLLYARGTERYSVGAQNVFSARSGGGEITIRAVAEHRSHIICDGRIAIGLGGGGTQTYLTESVLMLDPTAAVDAIPGLEIKTNDVQASHSAIASRVTAEDLFVFASRGIPEDEARRMFIAGFLGAMIDRIAHTDIAAQVRSAVFAKEAQG